MLNLWGYHDIFTLKPNLQVIPSLITLVHYIWHGAWGSTSLALDPAKWWPPEGATVFKMAVTYE